MVDLKVEELFVSAGINPRSHCLAACRSSDQFVYASNGQVILQRFPGTSHGVIEAVSERHHKSQITILKRITLLGQTFCADKSTDLFVSGGGDGNVVLYETNSSPSSVSHILTLDGPKGSIGALCGILCGLRLIIVASWVDETTSGVRVWWLNYAESTFSVSHNYDVSDLGNAFVLSADLEKLSNGRILMAFGTTKRTIELYCETLCEKEVKSVLSLVGHDDWIHSLSFNHQIPTLLATAGQDTQVKLWRIDKLAISEDVAEISVFKNTFTIEGSNPGDPSLTLSVGIESVLTGHDDWVQSVDWDSEGKTLATSSSDKTVIVWKETTDGQLWTDTVRLGIIGGQAAGFYSAVFSSDAQQIVASSYFGGLYAWTAPKTEEDLWSAAPVCSGHVGAVRDLAWHPQGKFVFSVGEDKTTRVYLMQKKESAFVEVGRPQVHGHSMQCIAAISRSVIVTGAEEKIFRAFEAPGTFVKSVVNIGELDEKEVFGEFVPEYYGARVPALGLSNKGLQETQESQPEMNGDAHWEEGAFQASPMELFGPPTEDCLQQNTLWPEIQKLYGHGYEVYAIATNPSGTVLATSCKASQAEDAAIVLWDTSDWGKKAETHGHTLTVTQLEWSPDGKLLLSVSRDRKAILYREHSGNVDGFLYEKAWSSGKEHSRIIWSCSWLNDSQHFLTASRDMQIILWECSESSATVLSSYKCPQPVTSVAAGYGIQISDTIVAAGLQDGSLLFLHINEQQKLDLIHKLHIPPIIVDQPILRLRFNPVEGNVLAVAGSDGTLRILRLQM
ncbi:unnamed protein product [Cylicocyclus nassatus]|uniref:Elongator complex protein 2 n=1 Tax=Cylicocyclus nassatus TaxID=53992 RepID=A0AA36GUK8_CYLNA|nr:unnamed protein product [Cylicocyclus nassatus]